MSNSIVIRFEAKDIEPAIFDDVALLTMDTEKDGLVGVYLPRPAFEQLFERMRIALEQARQDGHSH